MTSSSKSKSSEEFVKSKSRNARLVVRNLSFKCKEEDVRECFKKYGTIKEVTLLRKNGRLVGCGFVQFDKKNAAGKALLNTNGQNLFDRPMIVDWAVPKNKFHKILEVKPPTLNDTNVKLETKGVNLPKSNKVKTIKRPIVKEEKLKNESEKNDGRTIFLKDIPFQVTNEELKKCAEDLAGPVEYAVICIDPLTEHSKGTGFIRFKEKKVADEVLSNETKLVIFGKELAAYKLLEKEEMNNMRTNSKINKDNRNLYLIKEGVLVSGSTATVGVSKADLNKRLFLEQVRSKALRSLQKFVSSNRLIVYNLPLVNFDNKRLLELFKKHSPKGAVINEARVMRNLKDLNTNGMPASKGYGFVSYRKHEDALSALRTLNNNPNIFSDKKRPIVMFSIEDKKALKLKSKRDELIKKKKESFEKFHEKEKVSEVKKFTRKRKRKQTSTR